MKIIEKFVSEGEKGTSKDVKSSMIGVKADRIGVKIGEKIGKIGEKIENGFYFLADLGILWSDVFDFCSVFRISCWLDAVMIVRQILQTRTLKSLSPKLKNLRISLSMILDPYKSLTEICNQITNW